MSLDRFTATEPELASLVAAAGSAGLRSATEVAVELALEGVPARDLTDVIQGLASLRHGSFGSNELRRRIEDLWLDLDEQARVASGADPNMYLKVFSEARAVNALWYALDADAMTAAQGAIYEALHSIDDPTELRVLVGRALSPAGASSSSE